MRSKRLPPKEVTWLLLFRCFDHSFRLIIFNFVIFQGLESHSASETSSMVEGETGDDDDHNNIRSYNRKSSAAVAFANNKKKVLFSSTGGPNGDIANNGGPLNNGFLSLSYQNNGNGRFFNGNGNSNCTGNGNGIIRSLSLSTALDDIHVCKTCNIKERLGRTRRHLKPSVRRSFSKKELLSIFALGFIDFVGFCSMSVMAPFFPNEVCRIILVKCEEWF